jgi:hypothetical protein
MVVLGLKMTETLTLGDFKIGVSVGVYCTKCTLNTGVNTNFEITHSVLILRPSQILVPKKKQKIKFGMKFEPCECE